MANLLSRRGFRVVGVTGRPVGDGGGAGFSEIIEIDYADVGALSAIVADVRPDFLFNYAALSQVYMACALEMYHPRSLTRCCSHATVASLLSPS